MGKTTPAVAFKMLRHGMEQMDKRYYPLTLSTHERARLVLAAVRGDLADVVAKIRKSRIPRDPVQDWIGF